MYFVGNKSFKTVRDSFRYQVQEMYVGESRRFYSHGVKLDAIRRYFAQMFEAGCLKVYLDKYDLTVVCKNKLVLKSGQVKFIAPFKSFLKKYECDVINKTIIDVTEFKCSMSDAEKSKFEKMLTSKHISFLLRYLGYVPIKKRLRVLGYEHSVWFDPSLTDEQSARDQVREYHINYF